MNTEHHMARMGARPAADTLREAARLMRERAEDALAAWHAPWVHEGLGYSDLFGMTYRIETTAPPSVLGEAATEELAVHIASWHPAVALAVADWLDSTANDVEHVHTPVYNLTSTTVARSVAVARTYLGESS